MLDYEGLSQNYQPIGLMFNQILTGILPQLTLGESRDPFSGQTKKLLKNYNP